MLKNQKLLEKQNVARKKNNNFIIKTKINSTKKLNLPNAKKNSVNQYKKPK